MIDIGNIIFNPLATPAWVLVGGLVTKGVDGVINRRRVAAEVENSAVQGHAVLNKSLQESFALMAAEMTRMRHEHQADTDRWSARFSAMEREMNRLRSIIIEHGIPLDEVTGEAV